MECFWFGGGGSPAETKLNDEMNINADANAKISA
jgi:hypothetical protein